MMSDNKTQDNSKADEIFTYEQTANWAQIPRATLYSLVHERRIPFIRLGKRFVRFRRSELESWLRRGELTTADLGNQNSEAMRG